MFAQQRDTFQQIATLTFVDEWDERVPHFELDRIELQEIAHGIFWWGRCGNRRRRYQRLFRPPLLILARRARQEGRTNTKREERKHRQSWHQRKRRQHAGGHPHRARMIAELATEHDTNAITAGGARDHQAGGGADDQRRDL